MHSGNNGQSGTLHHFRKFINRFIFAIKKAAFTFAPKVNTLEPLKANATLGVTSEIIQDFLDSREKAAKVTGTICPMCIEDLKWGID